MASRRDNLIKQFAMRESGRDAPPARDERPGRRRKRRIRRPPPRMYR